VQYENDSRQVEEIKLLPRPSSFGSKIDEITNLPPEAGDISLQPHHQYDSGFRNVDHGLFQREINTNPIKKRMRQQLGISKPYFHISASRYNPSTAPQGELLRDNPVSSYASSNIAGAIARDHLPYIDYRGNITRGSNRKRRINGGRFSSCLRLVFELSPQRQIEEYTIGFPRREVLRGTWLLVGEKLDEWTQFEWENLCCTSAVSWDDYLYPLAHLQRPDGGIILGRKQAKGTKRRRPQLYIASFSTGCLYSLGTGSYTEQLRSIRSGEYLLRPVEEENMREFVGEGYGS
jgi:hypothetical protein